MTTEDLKTDVRNRLHSWNTVKDSAKERDVIRGYMRRFGYDNLGTFVFDVANDKVRGMKPAHTKTKQQTKSTNGPRTDVADNPYGEVEGNVHEIAKVMRAAGYEGQGMNEPDRSRGFIILAARNPECEHNMPNGGYGFWRAALFQFNVWKAEQDGDPPPPRRGQRRRRSDDDELNFDDED